MQYLRRIEKVSLPTRHGDFMLYVSGEPDKKEPWP